MKVSNRLTCGFAAVCLSLASTAGAQLPKGVTQADADAIQSLMGRYAHALGSCDADGFADLFAPKTGYFASGFRGEIVGREGLKALVQSERHCIESAGSTPAPRPGGTDGPKVVLEAVSGKVHGVADLGRAGEYQDEYVHTSDGWKFATRTVLTPPEKAAGLTAADFHAIQHVRGSKLVDFSAADQGGVKRFRTSGTAISVQDGAVKGRAYLKDGSYNDDVYEKTGPGKWRVKSSTHVPASAP